MSCPALNHFGAPAGVNEPGGRLRLTSFGQKSDEGGVGGVMQSVIQPKDSFRPSASPVVLTGHNRDL